MSVYDNAMRARRVAAKVCSRCGGWRDPASPFKSCEDCRIKYRRNHAKYKADDYWCDEGPAIGGNDRWKAIGSAQETPCARCGLRGEHECVPPSWVVAQRRNGAGRTLPDSPR